MATSVMETRQKNAAGLRLFTREVRGALNSTAQRDLLAGTSKAGYGKYRPTWKTVGCYQGVTRTDWNDPATPDTAMIVLTATNGQVFQNLNFYGDIRLQTPNVTFINCKFFGGKGHPAANRGSLTAYDAANHDGARFVDCEFTAQDPSYYRDGIVGNNFILERCWIYGTNDGVGAFAASGRTDCNVELYGCLIENLVWWGQDPAHTDGSHGDLVQFQGGTGFKVIGCTFIGVSTADPRSTQTADAGGGSAYQAKGSIYAAGLQITEIGNKGASDLVINYNFFGPCSNQISMEIGTSGVVVATMIGNVFAREVKNSGSSGAPIRRHIRLNDDLTKYTLTGLYVGQSAATNTTNVFEDTRVPLAVGNTLGIQTA